MPPKTRRELYGIPASFTPPPPTKRKLPTKGQAGPMPPALFPRNQPAAAPPSPGVIPVLPEVYNRGAAAQTQYPTARFGVPMTQTATGGPYPLYLPTITRTGTPRAAAGAAQPWRPPYEEAFGWWTPEQQAQVTYATQAPTPAAPPAGGGGGGGRGRGLVAAPPGVNPGWYAQFQREHEGQTPEQFYGQTGEGLPEAMADEEWARGFAQMMGRAPSQYDWEEHWYSTRGYGRPREQSPREYAAWQKARKERRRAKKAEKEGTDQPRPPVWMPPQVIWR